MANKTNPKGCITLSVFLLLACLVSRARAAEFWDITVVDSAYAGFRYSSVAVLPSGYPAISYWNVGLNDLKYAWYDGNTWHAETVDSAGAVGKHSSLAILPSGQPAISYYDDTNDDLKYAWFNGSTWHTSTVDSLSLGIVGLWTSLGVLPSGHPAISYYDSTDADLKYAWYDGSDWQVSIVDANGCVGKYSNLAVLPTGHPAITYLDCTNDALKYTWYDGSMWQISATGIAAGDHSLAILPTGHPAVSYGSGQRLKYAWYDGSTWQTSTVGSTEDVGWWTSLAILPSGHPAISYYEYTNHDLKYAWYDGTTWQTTLLDWEGETGNETSLAILPWGGPAISYSDYTNRRLKCALVRNLAPTPVAMDVNYTATAWTEYGGTSTVVNGPAYSEGTDPWSGAFSSSSVSLDTTSGGHLMGMLELDSCDEEWCVEWDPGTGECLWWEWIAAGASGTALGTIELGTSGSYPAGSKLELTAHVLVTGDLGNYYEEDYRLQLWRGASLLGQVDPCAPDGIIVPVEAGETLTFELFASEDHAESSDRGFEFRLILLVPGVGPGWTAEIADSAAEFSDTQGQDNWYYGYYDGDSAFPYNNDPLGDDFELMTEFGWSPTGDRWYVQEGEGGFWTSIGQVHMHPNGEITTGGRQPVEHWAVRRWVSEANGVVNITGHLADYSPDNGSDDGIVGHIIIDGNTVFAQIVYAGDTTGVDFSLDTTVTTGSLVDFCVAPRANDGTDTTTFTVVIGYYPGDMDGDGDIDWNDVRILAERWLDRCRPSEGYCQGADIDQNWKVDLGDFAILAANLLHLGCD